MPRGEIYLARFGNEVIAAYSNTEAADECIKANEEKYLRDHPNLIRPWNSVFGIVRVHEAVGVRVYGIYHPSHTLD